MLQFYRIAGRQRCVHGLSARALHRHLPLQVHNLGAVKQQLWGLILEAPCAPGDTVTAGNPAERPAAFLVSCSAFAQPQPRAVAPPWRELWLLALLAICIGWTLIYCDLPQVIRRWGR